MQLSSQARKAVAAGLALSTILWGTMLFAIPTPASAAVHSDGCVVLSGGVVYLVTGNTRRGFTSAEVFASSGYNFSQVVSATAEDNALTVGPIMTYADGTLVKGPNDPLVYLVAAGQKRPFVSGAVFLGLGYSFANIQQAPVNTFSDLPTGTNLDNATIAHPAGTLANVSGTVFQMTVTGKMGIPSMDVFNSYGFNFKNVVAGNASDASAANAGTLSARAACTGGGIPAVNGNVNISFAGPASTTLINDQSQADLADFVFSGTGTVTGVTLKRVGISADTALTNVFLFDGATRLTDAASVSSGSVINFTNSNGLFTVSGSRTISVKADMAGTAGTTIGIQLTSVTLSSGSVGGLPLNGNLHTVATATLAGVNLASPLTVGDTDPGKDIVVFQGNAAVTTRDVTMTRLALRQIGSIVNTDISNFRLFVDSVQVASQANLDANGYVTFNMSKNLTTGTRVLKVMADIIGGSGRTVQMSLRGAYDITVVDTQYNASPIVTATVATFPFGDSTSFAINAGTITALKASDSPSSNVTIGASDVPLGRWTLTAFGEPVKVETLTIAIATNGTDASNTFRNGRIMINGAQYGSTTDVTAAHAFASGQSFTVNYTVTPGSPATVEFRADMATTGTDLVADLTTTSIQVALFGGNLNNAIPQVSLGTLDVPEATQNANALTITSGSISLTELASYPDQTTAVPQSSYKLGAWTLTGNSTEAVNINTLDVGFVGADAWDPSSDLSNVYLKIGNTTTSIKGSVADGSNTSLANSYSLSYNLDKNASTAVELWATIASTASDGGGNDTMTAYLRATGITALSGKTVYADTNSDTVNTDAGQEGQTITAGTGTVTITKDGTAPTAKLVDDSGVVVTQAYKITAVTDSFTVTALDITFPGGSVVSGVVLKDGSTVVGSSKVPISNDITWSGMEIPVLPGQPKVLTVEATMSPIGVGAGISDSSLITTLVSFTARNSAGDSATSSDSVVIESPANIPGISIYAYKAIPTVSAVALPDSNLAAGAGRVISRFTVSSGGTGTIAWKQVMLEISKTATPTIASVALYNADTTELITSAFTFNNETVDTTATVCGADDTSCELLITVGANSDDQVVEQVSGAKNYEVRATIGGDIAATDSLSLTIDRNTTTHTGKGVFTAVDNSGTGASNPNKSSFVWSDESASATVRTDTSTWNDDYLVKNLPISWNLN